MKLIRGNPGAHGNAIPPNLQESIHADILTDGKKGQNKGCRLPKRMTEMAFRLFNLTSDPGESNDLASTHPELVEKLAKRLRSYEATMVPSHMEPEIEAGNPIHNDGLWTHGWCDSKP